MKSKKGFWLAGKVMSIIIAVACIIILIFLGVKMLNVFLKGGQETKQAEASLERIRQNIEIVEKNPSLVKEFFIESPNGWEISAWPYNEQLFRENWPMNIYIDELLGRMPRKCYQFGYKKNCLCICEFSPNSNPDGYLDACNKKAVCISVNKEIYTRRMAISGLPIRIGGVRGIESIIILNVSMDKDKIKLEEAA